MWISRKHYKELLDLISVQRKALASHEALIVELKKYNNSLKIANSTLENCLYGNNIKYPNSEED